MKNNSFPFWEVQTDKQFKELALDTFLFQYKKNSIYKIFCEKLKVDIGKVDTIEKIPFLPIRFFKTHKVVSFQGMEEITFYSSSTTQQTPSRHYIKSLKYYRKSFKNSFERLYGPISEYTIVALLPSYFEQKESSLLYMINTFIEESNQPFSGTYLNEWDKLIHVLEKLSNENKKIILWGVSYALLDLIEKKKLKLHNVIVMETGGMKGRRKEMIRAELHEKLRKGLGVQNIHSEYGMTELLSQSYSQKAGIFISPPWKKVLCRDIKDPYEFVPNGYSGALNIIDLANKYSCAFIATDDVGKVYENGTFEVLGRADNAEIRGCNLLV